MQTVSEGSDLIVSATLWCPSILTNRYARDGSAVNPEAVAGTRRTDYLAPAVLDVFLPVITRTLRTGNPELVTNILGTPGWTWFAPLPESRVLAVGGMAPVVCPNYQTVNLLKNRDLAVDRARTQVYLDGAMMPTPDSEGSRTAFDTLLAAYIASLVAGKKAEATIKKRRTQLAAIARDAGVTTLADWRPEPITAWVAEQSNGVKTSSLTQIVSIIRCFTGWLHKRGDIPHDWSKSLAWPRNDTDAEFSGSRAASLDEVRALVETTARYESFHRLPYMSRATWYLLACTCGLASCELERILWGDIDLVGGWIKLPRSRSSKGRKSLTIPIPPDTVRQLRWWKQTSTPKGDRVFGGRIQPHTFANDLERAGVQRHRDGRALTLHGLRKTYVSLLANVEGMPEAVRQDLARHAPGSTLTQDVYTDPAVLEKKTWAHKLPAIGDLCHLNGLGKGNLAENGAQVLTPGGDGTDTEPAMMLNPDHNHDETTAGRCRASSQDLCDGSALDRRGDEPGQSHRVQRYNPTGFYQFAPASVGRGDTGGEPEQIQTSFSPARDTSAARGAFSLSLLTEPAPADIAGAGIVADARPAIGESPAAGLVGSGGHGGAAWLGDTHPDSGPTANNSWQLGREHGRTPVTAGSIPAPAIHNIAQLYAQAADCYRAAADALRKGDNA